MGDQQRVRSEESLRHEYTEVVYNVRHYSNLRFAVFSIFFAVMAGVGIVAFGKGQFDAHAAMVARIAGVFVTMIFWMYEERCSQFFDHHTKAAAELERSLGYTQYITKPKPMRFVLEAKVANRLFFMVLALLWLYAAFAVPLGS